MEEVHGHGGGGDPSENWDVGFLGGEDGDWEACCAFTGSGGVVDHFLCVSDEGNRGR